MGTLQICQGSRASLGWQRVNHWFGCPVMQGVSWVGGSFLTGPAFPLSPPSAADMAKLAEEVFPCKTELLSGGLQGRNHDRILQHLGAGFPVLIPYPSLGKLFLSVPFKASLKFETVY